MAKKQAAIEEIHHAQLDELIQRVEYAIENDLSLSVEDLKLLLLAITTLSTLQQQLDNKEVTLHKLRKLLGMVQQSEKRHKGENGPSDEDKEQGKKKKRKPLNEKKEKKKKRPAQIPVIYHALKGYHSGMVCQHCGCGKLYKHEVAKLLRITGCAPYQATRHISEQLRCNACQAVETAELPAEVLADGEADQTYGYSARAMMVVHKFFSGIPYYHQGNLSDIFGYGLHASTIFNQCEKVADIFMPIHRALKQEASCAEVYLLDDTSNRILEQMPEYREKRNGKGQQLRTGVYSSGLIAFTAEGKEIVLFETSLGHAGELLDSILKNRAPELPPPITMSDASSNNTPVARPVDAGYCNGHSRRKFFDLEKKYPEEVNWVLDTYGIIWEAERKAKEEGLEPQKRLEHHKKDSLPAMERLRAWALEKQNAENFEENGALGDAICYLLNHYDRLTLFCRKEKVPLDNNRMEETLKMIIRGRKLSHFYKTVTGAGIANVLTSIIATAYRADTELFSYLVAVQRYQKHVKENPRSWLPWTYEETLRSLEALKPDKIPETV
jgi:transposase